jgi:feruloyl esterase
MPAGSERYWAAWFLDEGERVAPGNALGGDYARYLGFEEGAPAGYTAMDFDFDRDPARLQPNGRLLDALDHDLTAFRKAGGKYLMWHGWQDPLVLPDQSVAYYEAVLEEMGGLGEVESFFRLFMIPGQGHCWEMPSPIPDRFNPIEMLENWVEKGQAPRQLNVYSADPESMGIDAAAICPYPAMPAFFASADRLSDEACRQ